MSQQDSICIKINNKKFKFNRFNDQIIYNRNFHLYHKSSTITNHISDKDLERISIGHSTQPKCPKYLFVSLYPTPQNRIKFGIFNNSDKFKWEFSNGVFKNIKKGTYLGYSKRRDELIVSKRKFYWVIEDDIYIKSIKYKFYLSVDTNYRLTTTLEKNASIAYDFTSNVIHYIKPTLQVNFDIVNLNNPILSFEKQIPQKNVGILLVAGFSTRFDSSHPKQLYKIDDKPIFLYSLEVMLNTLNSVIVVTNSTCFSEIENTIKELTKRDKITILINDINCRLQSMGTALNYLKETEESIPIDNIIIHDGARPFIKEMHIQCVLNELSQPTIFYSQYYVKIVDGLINNNFNFFDDVNRDDFSIICTPIGIDYRIFSFLFPDFIQKERITWEFIPLLKLLRIRFSLIEGRHEELRKITIKNDIPKK